MIDTIVLRIHNLSEKYQHLIKYLTQINIYGYKKTFNHYVKDDNTKTSILFGDTGRILDIKHIAHINIPSSHYNIAFSVNTVRDFIEFNFSLPKYLYSTNVLQFVDHYDQSTKHVFDKLQTELTNFFNHYLITPPDWADVEINRIDLCFNQFFLSKGDALRYLDEQQKLNISYARSDTNKFQQYGNTTLSYKTENYSFKIYHKGTEFRKNDLTKLLKSNPKNIDIPHMTEQADKILRYELTARKPLMNYLFKQKIKDDENTMVNHNLTVIQSLRGSMRNTVLKNMNNVTAIKKATKNEVETYISKTINNKTFNFVLDSPWDYPTQTPATLMKCYDMPFDFLIFDHLYNFFFEKVKKYQLGVKLGLVDILQKIKEMQKEKQFKNKLFSQDDKVSQTGNLLMIATLSQYIDITDLKNVLPKATYYRYLKKMEELGIPKHSPDIAVRPPDLDYTTYFYEFSKYHKIFN